MNEGEPVQLSTLNIFAHTENVFGPVVVLKDYDDGDCIVLDAEAIVKLQELLMELMHKNDLF